MGLTQWLRKKVAPTKEEAILDLFERNRDSLEAIRKKRLLKTQGRLIDFSIDLNDKFVLLAEKVINRLNVTPEETSSIEILINDIERICGNVVTAWGLSRPLEDLRRNLAFRSKPGIMFKKYQSYVNTLLSRFK